MGVYTVNQTDGSLVRVAGGMLYADAPIGAIQSYGGETAPAGWLICDGSTLSRTDYAELFAVIGTNFGEGDGETTFNIPDLRECVPVGAGKNITKSITNHDRYNLGQFKDDELGKHNHPLVVETRATYNTAGVPIGIGNNNTPTSATHGKQLGVNYIIKAKQIAVPADIQSAIEAQNSYSTEEIYTGKRWIDGKLIYRKVFNVNNINTTQSAAWVNIAQDSWVEDIDTIVASKIIGEFGNTGSGKQRIVYFDTGISNDILKVYTGYTISIKNNTCVLEYTKTTG